MKASQFGYDPKSAINLTKSLAFTCGKIFDDVFKLERSAKNIKIYD